MSTARPARPRLPEHPRRAIMPRARGRWTMRRIAMAAMAAGLLGGCSMKADMEAGGKAIAAFHQALDAGQYQKIWAASAPDMKGATPEPRLTALLDAVHRRLGRFKSGSQTGFNDNLSGAGHMLTINF